MKKYLFLSIMFVVLFLGVNQANARTYYVTKGADDNGSCAIKDCALREAIIAADNNPGDDIIRFVTSDTSYLTLISGASDNLYDDLDITSSDKLTIIGLTSDSVIDGSNSNSIFYIGSSANVVLIDLTLQNAGYRGIHNDGKLTVNSCNFNTNDYAAVNYGVMIIKNSNFTNNELGILSMSRTLSVDSSVFDSNKYGINSSGSTANIKNSQFINNEYYGIDNSGDTIINNCIIDNNKKWGIANYDNLTIQNSSITNNGQAGIMSNGRYATDPLIINNTIIDSNGSSSDSSSSSSYHSGLYILATDSAIITNSSITNNTNQGTTYGGGGIDVIFSNVEIINSTISNNYSLTSGGGIYVIDGTYGGVYRNSNVNIAASTIAFNESNTDGGGIYNANSSAAIISVKNSIVSNNNSMTLIAPDCYGNITSEGYNLIQNTADCSLSYNATDLRGIDPLLQSLADNGGTLTANGSATYTNALDSTSSAVNYIPTAYCDDFSGDSIRTDQRGYNRPFFTKTNCDIGAYELQ